MVTRGLTRTTLLTFKLFMLLHLQVTLFTSAGDHLKTFWPYWHNILQQFIVVRRRQMKTSETGSRFSQDFKQDSNQQFLQDK